MKPWKAAVMATCSAAIGIWLVGWPESPAMRWLGAASLFLAGMHTTFGLVARRGWVP